MFLLWLVIELFVICLGVGSSLSSLQEQITSVVGDKLTATDTLVRDSISKVVKSKVGSENNDYKNEMNIH